MHFLKMTVDNELLSEVSRRLLCLISLETIPLPQTSPFHAEAQRRHGDREMDKG